jgi:hypothetical protein
MTTVEPVKKVATSTYVNKKVFFTGSDLESIAKLKKFTITYELTDKLTKKGNPYYAFKMVDSDGKVILARNAVKYTEQPSGVSSYLVFKEEYDESRQFINNSTRKVASELGLVLDA